MGGSSGHAKELNAIARTQVGDIFDETHQATTCNILDL